MSPGPESTQSGIEPVVTVIVVTNQGSEGVIRRCLAALEASGDQDHVLIVDNSGTEPTSAGVETASFVDAWIRAENQGFGAAANTGVAAARARWGDGQLIALLNDDTRVASGWISPLLNALADDPAVGAVQPKLILGDTEPVLINSVGVELDDFGAGADIGCGALDGPKWGVARPIDIFTGGAVLFRTEFLIESGGFDERYFLYYEDVDLALRGAELGWTFRCEPSSVVEHWPGSSTVEIGSVLRLLQERNRLWTTFRFGSAGSIGPALWLSVRRLRHEPRRVHARALLSGLGGWPRLAVERRRARRT